MNDKIKNYIMKPLITITAIGILSSPLVGCLPKEPENKPESFSIQGIVLEEVFKDSAFSDEYLFSMKTDYGEKIVDVRAGTWTSPYTQKDLYLLIDPGDKVEIKFTKDNYQYNLYDSLDKFLNDEKYVAGTDELKILYK